MSRAGASSENEDVPALVPMGMGAVPAEMKAVSVGIPAPQTRSASTQAIGIVRLSPPCASARWLRFSSSAAKTSA